MLSLESLMPYIIGIGIGAISFLVGYLSGWRGHNKFVNEQYFFMIRKDELKALKEYAQYLNDNLGKITEEIIREIDVWLKHIYPLIEKRNEHTP